MRLAKVLSLVALFLSAFSLGLCVHSLVDKAYGGEFERNAFAEVSDKMMPPVEVQQPEAGEQAVEPDSELIQEPVHEEPEPVYVWEPEWAAEPAWTSPDAISESVGETDFKTRGVVYEDGTRFTWYGQKTLPGGGLTELNSNGRTVDERGFVTDGDGYIAVASSDLPKGTHVDTPWGEAVVYDSGCPSGTVDIYTNWG